MTEVTPYTGADIEEIGRQNVTEGGSMPSTIDRAKAIAREQIGNLAREAADRIGERAAALRDVGSDLRDRGQPAVADVAERAASEIEKAAEYIRTVDGAKLMADFRELARRRPAAVAAAGFLVGLAAARVIKALRTDHSGHGGESTPF